MTAIERASSGARSILALAFALALATQGLVAASIGFRWGKAQSAPVAAEPLIAEIYERLPEQSRLAPAKGAAPSAPRPIAKVRPMSKETPRSAAPSSPAPAGPAPEERNEAPAGKDAAASPASGTHGPAIAFGPSPQLPAYLRDQSLQASAVIEFAIAEDGSSVPRLLASSGNDELDALALASAKQWKFTPAMRDNRPIASKARLRLNFQVK